MTSVHSRIHRLRFCRLACAATFVAIGSHLFAAETTPPKSHSLIHRQATEVTPTDAGTATAPPNSSSSSGTSIRQRKLTKRPAQSAITAPSGDKVTSQTTPPSSQPLSPVQTNKPTSENRTSMAATGLAAIGASALTTAPLTTAGTSSAASSGSATASSAKTPVAGAISGIGAASTGSPGRVAPAGRGLQGLLTQMPGLTQLVAPTISVSSPPSSSSPPPTTTSPPSSSSPPPATTSPPPLPSSPSGTGSAILSWTLNSDGSVAGYKIYVGTASGLYTYPGSPFVVSLTGSYTIIGLPSGQTYYFAISAFNASGGESALSAEVSKSIY